MGPKMAQIARHSRSLAEKTRPARATHAPTLRSNPIGTDSPPPAPLRHRALAHLRPNRSQSVGPNRLLPRAHCLRSLSPPADCLWAARHAPNWRPTSAKQLPVALERAKSFKKREFSSRVRLGRRVCETLFCVCLAFVSHLTRGQPRGRSARAAD